MKTNLQLTFLLLLIGFLGFAQTGPGEIDNTFNFSGNGPFGGAIPGNAAYPQYSVDGLVYKTKVYGPASIHKDKIVIIGRFTSYNGVAREYVGRLNPDGTLDTTWIGPNLSTGYLYCVEVLANDKILIGGSFTVVQSGITYKNIARLNPDGSIDATFIPSAIATRGTNSEVHAITVINPTNLGSKMYIGGTFTSFTGTTGRLFRLNADGTRDATFTASPAINGEIRAIAVQRKTTNTEKVLVGGFFDAVFPSTTTYFGRLVRLMPDGEFDSSFNVGGRGVTGGSAVFDIALSPNDFIYAVGKFTQYNGTVRNSFIKLNPDGVVDVNNRVGVASGQTIFAVKLQPDGKILIGGNFTSYNNNTSGGTATVIPKGIARLTNLCVLDGTFLTGTGFHGGTGVYEGVSVIRDIVQQSDTKIIVSGDYTDYDNVPRRMIARIKTRECSLAAIYNGTTLGWANGIEPLDDTYYMAIASGTLTIPSGTHMTVCELEIKANATLVVEENASITVKGVLMNNGTFQINSSGSLVQVKEDAVNADLGDGIFKMNRKTTPVKRFDYTYWSSPVEKQDLYTFSPETLFDKYYKWNPTGNSWTLINFGAEMMTVGQGYIVRAPQSVSPTVASIVELTFMGRPNNGLVEVNIATTSTSKLNLIGNPYPSAVDALLFLNHPTNTSKVGGTIYLWTHKTTVAPSAGSLDYQSDDYLIYNKLGTTVHSPTGVPFDGKIAAGQGFFINGIVTSGKAIFNNAMRVSGNDTNTQFYRMANQSNNNTRAEVQQPSASFERSRLWLNLTNAQGAFKQTLVGYATDATDGFDRDYDGAVLNGNSFVNLYTIAEGKNYAIQGRALPLNDTKMVKVGYSVSVAGSFTITLPEFDGLFENYNIYLFDNLLNTRKNLRGGSYTFTTAIGTFDNRFELHFKERSNGLDKISADEMVSEKDIAVIKRNDEVSIKSTILINDVTVYDLSGKMIFSQNDVNAVEFNTGSLNIQSSVVIVKMKLNNGQEVSKKIIVD